MRWFTVSILMLLAAACGDDGGGGGNADAATAPAMITVSGTASQRSASGSMPVSGATVGAYREGMDASPVVMTMTDASGNYALMIPTGGVAVDGYVKATFAGLIDTYLYPPEPLSADFDGASVNMINTQTLDLLSGTLCGSAQEAGKGVIAVLVVDTADMPVAGATVTSSPAAAKVCYNSGGFPSRNATATDTDGIAYLLNVTAGSVNVSASKSGLNLPSHSVNARAGVFTTTPVQAK